MASAALGAPDIINLSLPFARKYAHDFIKFDG